MVLIWLLLSLPLTNNLSANDTSFMRWERLKKRQTYLDEKTLKSVCVWVEGTKAMTPANPNY